MVGVLVDVDGTKPPPDDGRRRPDSDTGQVSSAARQHFDALRRNWEVRRHAAYYNHHTTALLTAKYSPRVPAASRTQKTRAQLSLGLADRTHGAHSQPASITVRVWCFEHVVACARNVNVVIAYLQNFRYKLNVRYLLEILALQIAAKQLQLATWLLLTAYRNLPTYFSQILYHFQLKNPKLMWPWPWNPIGYVRLSRYMFVQNFIELSAAVHELS